jgi:hypothetical protein
MCTPVSKCNNDKIKGEKNPTKNKFGMPSFFIFFPSSDFPYSIKQNYSDLSSLKISWN